MNKLFLLIVLLISLSCNQQSEKVPMLDLHVHLSDSLPIEKAVEIASSKGVQFGIVEHPGLCEYCPISNDELLKNYISQLRKYPVYVGIQPVVPGWRELFTTETLQQLDYIIMDAMEIPQEDGSIWRIWMEDTKVESLDAFMEMYVEYHVQILEKEGINVLANATFLPKCIESEYAIAWTKERMLRVIDAAVKNSVAIEINSYYKVPNEAFIQMAKDAGAKFSFGTNSRDNFAGTMDYALQMVETCKISPKDIFLPSRKI